jgi:hypothetical protein
VLSLLTCQGNYNVVNLILNKGLHTESDDCMTYTTTLMDQLERFKLDNQGNDAVHDDVTAQAYVEQFALDTFQRADRTLRAKKATKSVESYNLVMLLRLTMSQTYCRNVSCGGYLLRPPVYLAKSIKRRDFFQVEILQISCYAYNQSYQSRRGSKSHNRS